MSQSDLDALLHSLVQVKTTARARRAEAKHPLAQAVLVERVPAWQPVAPLPFSQGIEANCADVISMIILVRVAFWVPFLVHFGVQFPLKAVVHSRGRCHCCGRMRMHMRRLATPALERRDRKQFVLRTRHDLPSRRRLRRGALKQRRRRTIQCCRGLFGWGGGGLEQDATQFGAVAAGLRVHADAKA